MKKIILLIAFLAFALGYISAQTTISGKLVGYDGKPMKIAHVTLLKNTTSTILTKIQTGADGSYSVTTNEKGPYTIRFTGLFGAPENILIYTEGYCNEKIDMQLGQVRFTKGVLAPYLVGDFNDWDTKKIKPMLKSADGKYHATIETDKDKIRFRYIIGYLGGSNGDMDGEFEYDDKRGYLTIVKPTNGKAEIVLDSLKLNYDESLPVLKFENSSSAIARIANVCMESMLASKKYMYGMMGSLVGQGKFTCDVTETYNKISRLIDSEKDLIAKNVMSIILAEVPSLSMPLNQDLAEKASLKMMKAINPDSPLLAVDGSSWVNTVFSAKEAEIKSQNLRRDYVDAFLEKNSISNEAKAKIIMNILAGIKTTYNEPARKKYYELMVNKYSDTEAGKKIKDYSEEYKIGKGVPVPKFSLVSHEDPKVIFTNESFKGKIYMIDFWATWCGPCKAEMPELHKVYEKFKGKGFEILSISYDQKAEAINKYRAGEFKMPWHHAFVEGEIKAKLAKEFDALSIPKPFLIDGNTGKILAMTNELRGAELEKTLQKYLK